MQEFDKSNIMTLSQLKKEIFNDILTQQKILMK